MKVTLSAEEMMDMVRTRLVLNGIRFENLQHVVKTPTNSDVPEYEGVSFEMQPTALMKNVQ